MSRIIYLIGCTLMMVFLSVVSANAADKVLSVSSASGVQGERIILNILVDDSANTAGASFTLTYSKSSLSLVQVKSNFFGTFAAQGVTPTQLVVDNITYYGPLLYNTDTNTAGTMLAAARADNGTGTNITLFTLAYTIADSAASGSYPVNIINSTITNTAAGYSASGEQLPMLVGIDGTSFVTHTVSSVVPGLITVQPFVDADSDGINDNWEIAQVLPGTAPEIQLTIFSAKGDFDKDGYTDLQEYKNRGIVDPNGALFDPTIKNTPGGTGYVKKKIKHPGVKLLLNDE